MPPRKSTTPRKAPADRQSPTPRKPATKARLLKVQVQAILAIDDGTHLHEVALDPQSVPAADWESFAANAFSAADMGRIVKAYEQQRQQPQG